MSTSKKKIVMWGVQDLLGSSIKSILTSHKGWELICVSNGENVDALHTILRKVNPDILIIRCEIYRTNLFLPMQFIHDYPEIKVITIGLENNSMEVHSKQTFVIKRASDLIAVLDDNIYKLNSHEMS